MFRQEPFLIEPFKELIKLHNARVGFFPLGIEPREHCEIPVIEHFHQKMWVFLGNTTQNSGIKSAFKQGLYQFLGDV